MTTITDNLSVAPKDAAIRGCTPSRGAAFEEKRRARRYPISRWYLRPAAGWMASALAPTRVRPVHLTVCGLAFGVAAAAILLWRPELAPLGAAFVLGAWLFDRADGQLARRQGTVSAWGAWLDAGVDELVDVGLHAAVAAVAARQTASPAPWLLLAAFLAGKYLFMHGLAVEESLARQVPGSFDRTACPRPTPAAVGWLRTAYHLPANADVRIHLLAAALLTGWLCIELAFVAVYYNLRWAARYVLVARRLGGRR